MANKLPTFASPVVWDNQTSYEALKVVIYDGHAYTSKQAVPAGTSLSNTNYWYPTGNIYNVLSELNNTLTNKLLIGRTTITGDNSTNKISKVIDITSLNPSGLPIKGVLLQWLDTDNVVTYADYLNVVTYSATSLTISTKWRTANNYSWQFEYVLIT